MSDAFALPREQYIDKTAIALQSDRPQPPIRHPRDLVPIRESLFRTLPKLAKHDVLEHGRTSVVDALWLNRDATQMFFLNEEFAALFNEMRATIDLQTGVKSLVEDIVGSQGPNGSVLMAFDDRAPSYLKMPVMLSPIGTDEFTTLEGEEPLAWALISWRWLGEAQGIRFSSMHMRRRLDEDEVGYEPAPTPRGDHDLATAQLVLMIWVLLNPGPRMVEIVERKATAGMPPRAKKNLSRIDREAVVKVVKLNSPLRRQIGEVLEAQRTLRHRFVVRGHWRKQRVGTGRVEVRLTYVAPYVKGPADAPFVARETVYKWS